MSATHINRWLDLTSAPEPRARELGLSALATAALFAAALAAMTSLRAVRVSSDAAPQERVQWVPIPTPTPVIAPAPVRPRAIAPRDVPATIDRAPTAPAVESSASAPISSPRPASADTAVNTAAPPSPTIPLSILPPKTPPYVPHSAGGGAPISPAGVTAQRITMTARIRDSVIAASMAEVPDIAGPGRSQTGVSSKVPARSTGEPVMGVGVTLPFPIFEPGPSAAQRKRDAVVAAENQARLYRLQDRMYQKRDSIRLDSLRRDSLAMKRTPTSLPSPPPSPF
ncbi:MAG: hypothetical protein JWM41_3634 [Gemmatimonadetes bacterium]|nr:hypothetical protein [Gemmatimonadota bacterium]